MEQNSKADVRDYLAAERTFLAWMRTGLALMGFGFVVARFGLFLQQLQFFPRADATLPAGFSLWFGTALIAAGIAVNVGSAWRHVCLVRELDRGQPESERSLTLSISTALFLAVVGLAMAIYLVSVRHSATSNRDIRKEIAMSSATSKTAPDSVKGFLSKPSSHSVNETVDRLKNILRAKGVTLFALVDHSGEAEKAGLHMRNTKLLIFGSPIAGTPLMLAAPTTAIDLPLKLLVWQDASDKVWISYNSPDYLRERHGFPQELLVNISVVETLAAKAGE